MNYIHQNFLCYLLIATSILFLPSCDFVSNNKSSNTTSNSDLLGSSENQNNLEKRVTIEELGLSFTMEPYVNPAVIKEYITWISDEESQITAFDVFGTKQDSNRFSAKVKSKLVDATPAYPLVYYQYTDFPDPPMFGYRYVGRTTNGVYVLRTIDDTGGTATLSNLLFMEVVKINKPLVTKNPKSLKEVSNFRYEFRKIAEIGLGNHTSQKISVVDNTAIISEDLDSYGEQFPSGPLSFTVVDPM